MINYSDAELTSVLPSYIKNDADMQAISYAYQMAIQQMLRFSRSISLYSNIDQLDEDLLDLMALELGTQYYDETMDIRTKQNLIKNTLAWYKKAGTPGAVAELIEVAFGEGYVQEWFEYGGDPFMFRIITNASLTPEMNALFDQMVKKVKNTRSHLESISIIRTIRQTLYGGVGSIAYSHPPAVFEGGYQTAGRIESTILSGSAQQAGYKPSAVFEGAFQISQQVESEIITGAAQRVGYKPSAIIEEGYHFNRRVDLEFDAGTGVTPALIKTEAIKQE